MEFLSLLRTDPHTALNVKRQTYSDILAEFARHFTFDYLHEQESYRLDFYRSYDSSPRRVFDKQAFADMLHQSLAFNVEEVVDQMLEKIEIGARNASPDAFEAGIFPFMSLTFQTALDYPSDSFSKLFRSLVEACMERFIGHEPVKPHNWTRKACGCGCVHCRALDGFLADPKRQQMRLEKFNLNERKHLTDRICHEDCDAEPDRRQSPHALVLTKNFRGWSKNLASWKGRLDGTTNRLRRLKDQTSVEKLLGDQFSRLSSMNKIKIPRASDLRDPPSDPLVIQTKQQVEEMQQRRAGKPQCQSQQNRVPTKRPLSETQPTGLVTGADVKRPRLEESRGFIDLTNEWSCFNLSGDKSASLRNNLVIPSTFLGTCRMR